MGRSRQITANSLLGFHRRLPRISLRNRIQLKSESEFPLKIKFQSCLLIFFILLVNAEPAFSDDIGTLIQKRLSESKIKNPFWEILKRAVALELFFYEDVISDLEASNFIPPDLAEKGWKNHSLPDVSIVIYHGNHDENETVHPSAYLDKFPVRCDSKALPTYITRIGADSGSVSLASIQIRHYLVRREERVELHSSGCFVLSKGEDGVAWLKQKWCFHCDKGLDVTDRTSWNTNEKEEVQQPDG